MTLKKIEVTYGMKRPILRYSSELISITLSQEAEVKDDADLVQAADGLFGRARKLVERQQVFSEQRGIKARFLSG